MRLPVDRSGWLTASRAVALHTKRIVLVYGCPPLTVNVFIDVNVLTTDFDAEKNIIQIQNRPAIWTTKSAKYSDKNLSSKAFWALQQTIQNAYSHLELGNKDAPGTFFLFYFYYVTRVNIINSCYFFVVRLGNESTQPQMKPVSNHTFRFGLRLSATRLTKSATAACGQPHGWVHSG